LLITCSDSRINPTLLTQTEPGELFILRNAGNIIPPYGSANGGEGATVEYAVQVLGIKHLILCGHSHCGAVQALLKGDSLKELPAVSSWFAHAESTRRIMLAKYVHQPESQRVLLAVMENVLRQLDNLRTHPAVAAGLAQGDLTLYGWVYILETGEVLAYEPAQGRFAPLVQPTGKQLLAARLALPQIEAAQPNRPLCHGPAH
jgi:carbonic anhydrase